MVEQGPLKPKVAGSTPARSTNYRTPAMMSAGIAEVERIMGCPLEEIQGITKTGELVLSKICRSCEGQMIQVRGFWACPELTCSMVGQQQGRV